MKYTRKDYMAAKCTHSGYYGQFVGHETRWYVSDVIGRDKIVNSEDPHFNDIPLKSWDHAAKFMHGIGRSMRDLGDYPTLAGQVCVLKEAARQIKEKALTI